jgi:tetratricopeptide (TPR) repeat protein
MPLRHSLIAVAALLSAALPASGKDMLDYEWIEVRTPHFAVASAQDPEKTLELAVDLENFRVLVEMLSNIGRFEERIPTKIYLLPKPEKDLGFNGLIAGYFSSGMRANYAAIIPSGAYSDEVLKHEYVHFLIHNRDRLLYPTWFDEGFADLFATLRVRNGTLEYGKPMDARISWLVNEPWLSYKTILNARDTGDLGRDRGAQFYAQSWLLVHYLNIGSSDFSRKGTEFLGRRERGEPVEAAFEAAFGIPVSSLTIKLQRYLPKLHYFKGTVTKPLPTVETKTRLLSRAEIAAQLGALALRTNGAEAAQTYFEAALAADPNHGPALTGVGDVHKFAGRFEEARPFYEKAIALEPDDENHELDFAEYLLDLATREEEREGAKDSEQIRKQLVEARRHFMRAYKLNPDNPEILALNGATYLFEGEDAAKGLESLEAAHSLLPSQPEIRLLLARGYVAAGETEKARRELETLLAWTHAEGVETIRVLLESLGNEAPADGTTGGGGDGAATADAAN